MKMRSLMRAGWGVTCRRKQNGSSRLVAASTAPPIAWGNDYYDPALGWRANSWQGAFPSQDEVLDGFHGLAPVGVSRPTVTAFSI